MKNNCKINQNNYLSTNDFDYVLDEKFIAQFPSQKRDESKLLVLDKKTGDLEQKKFFNIVDYFSENDILVLNNTKVFPARLYAKKDTGANIEVFLLKNIENQTWECLLKPAKRVKKGLILKVSEELSVEIVEPKENMKWEIKLIYDLKQDIYDILNRNGNVPLPPYIERKLTNEQIKNLDYERYQTVFAKNTGSVAAPTAGLHFTEGILKQLEQKGVQICYVTLNVGLGTFKPVTVENVLEHKMDSESFEITEETAKIINDGLKQGKKITAVGTTSVRTLETAMQKYGEIKAVSDHSEIFIYPGYEFKIVDRLITNFHLPKSTLIMLVSALSSKEMILNAYEYAKDNDFRFYSYGDCMLIK